MDMEDYRGSWLDLGIMMTEDERNLAKVLLEIAQLNDPIEACAVLMDFYYWKKEQDKTQDTTRSILRVLTILIKYNNRIKAQNEFNKAYNIK